MTIYHLAQLTAAAAASGSMRPATDGRINFVEDPKHSHPNGDPDGEEDGACRDRAKPDEEEADQKRKRDTTRKLVRDPLTSMTHQLAARHASTSTSTAYKPKLTYPPRRPSNANAQTNENITQLPEVQREMRRSETSSSVYSGGYGDMLNRCKVEEAHRGQERRDLMRTRR
ncbi:hypothetical protein K438DRAFT_1966028 [Mycena galopus ATCC 62051]|nr:hypothetical protein K438DRAFT_1966028 [Mycena galopus ATCC 62051]